MMFRTKAQEEIVLLDGDPALSGLRGMRTQRSALRNATHARGYHEYSEAEKAKMDAFESLDFATIDNQILREHDRKVTKSSHAFKTFGKWAICFMIGAVTGIIAYGLKWMVDEIVGKKLELAFTNMHNKNYFIAGLIYLGSNVFLVAGSVLVIFFVGPLASGSGIPEVKAYLNGVRIPDSLNMRTLAGKILSLFLSFSSGLFLGPEGPMVHIGGMVGAAVGQMKSKTIGWYPAIFWKYHNHKDRRDFIAVGAASGIAAAFGAPIGGVLFSIEEVASFWSRQLTWRTFFCCMIATFTVNLFFQGFGIQIHDYGLLTFGFSRAYLYTYAELLPFAALGALGGILGAAFVTLTVRLVKWRDYWLGNRRGYRLADALALIVMTSSVMFSLAALMPCRPLSGVHPPANQGVCDKVDPDMKLVTMFCPSGYYSDMGSLLLAPLDSSLNLLFSRYTGIFFLPTLIIYAVLTFFLAVCTTGVWVASGLFVPTMVVGGAVGRVMGEIVAIFFSRPSAPIDPSIYSMIGSAALMAGSTRMTISLVVIIMELTEGTQYLLPIMLSVMLAKWVGDLFNESIYEHLMEHKCFPFLPSQPPRSKAMLSVADITRREVVTLRSTEKVSHIVDILQSNNHNGFPVIDPCPTKEGGHLVLQGLILRSQLIVLLEQKIFYEKSANNSILQFYDSLSPKNNLRDSFPINEDNNMNISMSLLGKKINHEEFTECLSRRLPEAGAIPLTAEERDMYIDLRPYMNLSPAIIKDTASFSEGYYLFRTLGLRHLVVIDGVSVVGIITRKDLL